MLSLYFTELNLETISQQPAYDVCIYRYIHILIKINLTTISCTLFSITYTIELYVIRMYTHIRMHAHTQMLTCTHIHTHSVTTLAHTITHMIINRA